MEAKFPLRKIQKEQLDSVLRAHQEWLETKGTKGKRASLCMFDLSGFDLQEADLRKADISCSNFDGVSIIGTRLEEADLQEAILANLKGVKSSQFGGANVCGTILPDGLNWDISLQSADELSKKAGKLLIWMLAICIYSLLTVATTTDAKLITNSPTSALPFVNAQIPIVYFYTVAPPLIVGFFIWFHLYLIKLWEVLITLPAIFPDGNSLDSKLCSWLPVGMVYSFFFRLRNYRRPLFFLTQKYLIVASAWVGVPFTLFLMWFTYLKRQDLWQSYIHTILVIFSIVVSLSFYFHMKNILSFRKQQYYIVNLKKPWRLFSVLGLGLLLFFITYSSILGNYYFNKEISLTKKIVPGLLMITGIPRIIDISGQNVSVGYSGEDINLIQGAQLKGRRLRYCHAFKAFLVNADLRFANLYNAFLSGANLRCANLRHAQMQSCYLIGSDLRESDLSFTNLQNADLSEADCRKASFILANLKKAIIVRTVLSG